MDLGSGKKLFRIQDPRVKKAPVPGSQIQILNTILMRKSTLVRYTLHSIICPTMIIPTHLGDRPVVLVGMLLMDEWAVPLAENHERVHRPPNAVRPPNRLLRRRRRRILIVEYVFVREVHTWRFGNITLL
jgi:hypothetical protein